MVYSGSFRKRTKEELDESNLRHFLNQQDRLARYNIEDRLARDNIDQRNKVNGGLQERMQKLANGPRNGATL